jgi:hypothetical protein
MNTQEKCPELGDTPTRGELLTDQSLEPLYKRIFVLEENLTERETIWIMSTLLIMSGMVEGIVDYFMV